jgi:hypothetical protein
MKQVLPATVQPSITISALERTLFPLRVIFNFGAVLNNDRFISSTGDIARALLLPIF